MQLIVPAYRMRSPSGLGVEVDDSAPKQELTREVKHRDCVILPSQTPHLLDFTGLCQSGMEYLSVLGEKDGL